MRDWLSQLAIARWLDAPAVAGRPFRWGDSATLMLLIVVSVLGVVAVAVLRSEPRLLLVLVLPIIIVLRVLLRRGLTRMQWWSDFKDWFSQLAIGRWLEAPAVAGRPFRWGDNSTLMLLIVASLLGVVVSLVLRSELRLLLVLVVPVIIVLRVLLRRGLTERFGENRRGRVRLAVLVVTAGSGLAISQIFGLLI
jgi:hypothetical protein